MCDCLSFAIAVQVQRFGNWDMHKCFENWGMHKCFSSLINDIKKRASFS